MRPAPPAPPLASGALPEPEPPLAQRLLCGSLAVLAAAALLAWTSGHFPGDDPPDARSAVAACWDAIERTPASGSEQHAMRVACQQMEHWQAAAAAGRAGPQLVAAGE